MKTPLFSLTLVGLLLLVASCGSGDDSPKCGFSNQTKLADLSEAPWPKFARDNVNSGWIEDVTIAPAPVARWIFPSAEGESPLSPISNSALIGAGGRVYFVGTSNETGSSDINLYVLDAATGTVLNNITPTPEPTPIETPPEAPPKIGTGTVSGTPLLAADGTVYVPFGDGFLSRFEEDEEKALTQTLLGGFISSSPAIADDGTVYLGSLGGIFSAVCPNGIARFAATIAPTQSSAAIIDGETTRDRVIVFAGNDGQVRAVDYQGRQQWVFFATTAVRSSVVVDQREFISGDSAGRVYVADAAGWIFARQLANGREAWTRRAGSGAQISATPALGKDLLYVADEGGTLQAFQLETGEAVWACTVGGPIRSSPAVASSDEAETVVFGADDATVYAVNSAWAGESCPATPPYSCDCSQVSLWTLAVDASVGRASPSIDFDGTVYIGTEGGRLYAIGASSGTPVGTGTPTPTPTPENSHTPTATSDEAR